MPSAVLPRRRRGHRAFPGGVALLAALGALGIQAAARSWVPGRSNSTHSLRSRMAVRATATDTFDPWSVLGISPNAGIPEARRAYKKLITKYHPDVDPSPEAEIKFQQAVRAFAVASGDDKQLDQSTLLSNAVENLRNDLEFKKARIEELKRQAEEEEQAMKKVEDVLEETKLQKEIVNKELGAFGGAAIGLVAGGLPGLVVGSLVGLALKDRDDAVGRVLRGVGTVTKAALVAVQAFLKKSNAVKAVKA